jgi:Flp pilus assembly protein TadG
MIRYRSPAQRRPAYLPEFALVAIVFFMFVFGVVEYARFVFTLNMMFNACREGARFAATHTTTQSTSQVQTYVNNYLVGSGVNLSGFNTATSISIYQANPTTGLDNGNGWQNASQGDSIGVSITGTYVAAVPSLLLWGSAPTVTTVAIVYSETQ